ncbi:MAG: LysR family transcriptional regulator [Pseudomonadota bacterium]
MRDINVSLSALRLFADVARAGSFAATARLRGLDPSIISRQIAGLEDGLGFRLFDRTTRRLNLTEAGRLYLERARLAVEELETARQEASDVLAAPRGLLRVTASVALGERWLMPRLPGFRTAYPDLHLDLRLTDAVLDIAAEGIDLAIRLAPRPDGAFMSTRLMDTRYRVVASPNYLRNAPALAQPDDLRDHDCLRLALPGYRDCWRFRRDGAVREIAVDGSLVVSSALALRRATLDGLGPSLMGEFLIADDLLSGRLVDALPDWDASAADFDTAAWILYPSRDYVPGKLRVFIDHLKASV